ncbi:MAG: GT4 family glycosyltransferase PelF [Verrucomicrobiota bacterium]
MIQQVDSSPTQSLADVCFILEGTYPHVRGGVSTWVHQLIEGMPNIRFATFFIGADEISTSEYYYERPANHIHHEKIYLFDRLSDEEMEPAPLSQTLLNSFYTKLEHFYTEKDPHAQTEEFFEIIKLILETPELTFGNLCHDQQAWNLLEKIYYKYLANFSFLDYFWTVRFLHIPVWRLIRHCNRVPQAHVYHTISTGYAGLVGAILARQTKRPLILTEHGIYTKERILEINRADWIYEPERRFSDPGDQSQKLRELWIAMFRTFGIFAYRTSNYIYTLYEGNAKLQVEFGASEKKIEVIPNGIHPERFDQAIQNRRAIRTSSPNRKIAGFVGRVVPIKDIKMLLRAWGIVITKLPSARLQIYGPEEEDQDYYQDCNEIIKMLHLEESILFMGSSQIDRIMPEIDVMVLTSLSEGLPLVVLEAFAAEVPVVCTDVGACRELIFGRTAEDKALGRAGMLNGTSMPQDTAESLTTILGDRKLQDKMGAVGRQRVEKFYRQTDILNQYHKVYTKDALQS